MKSASHPRPIMRRLRWPLALLALGVAAHGAAWFIVTGQIVAAIPIVRENAAAAGWVLDGGPPERAGWPWAAVVRIAHPTASTPPGAPDGTAFRWIADAIDLAILPWDPYALHASPLGPQTIAIGSSPPIAITARQATLRVMLSGDGPWTLNAADIDGPGFRAGHMALSATPLGADLAASSITLARPLKPPFDTGLALSATLAVKQPIPRALTPAAMAAAWRASGNEAGITALDLHWGPLHVEGTARLWLDAALQPSAVARLQIEGAGPLLDAAAGVGLMAPGPLTAAKTVLSLMSLGGGAVTTELSLRDRVLKVAQFPIAKLPLLNWDGP